MERILIAGGSGLIGQAVVAALSPEYEVRVLSRSPGKMEGSRTFLWDPENGRLDPAAIEGVDHIINLSGAGIADSRWTDRRKEVILSSRVDGNLLLRDALKKTGHRPKTFISASAIGYYGDRGGEALTEKSDAGSGFLSQTAIAWEKAAREVGSCAEKWSILRFGIVLAKEGGALPQLTATRHIRMLNYFGDGQGYYAWVHLDDVVKVVKNCIENPHYQGVMNVVAPQPETQKQFVRKIGKGLGGPFLYIPVPRWVMKGILGEMSAVVLDSTRAYPEALEQHGHTWRHPDLEGAIRHLFS